MNQDDEGVDVAWLLGELEKVADGSAVIDESTVDLVKAGIAMVARSLRTREFRVGDVARLASGGPRLTLLSKHHDHSTEGALPLYRCMGFIGEKFVEVMIVESALRLDVEAAS